MKKVLLILTTAVLLQACGGGGSSPLAESAVTPQLSVSALGSGTDPSLLSEVAAAPKISASAINGAKGSSPQATMPFEIPKWAPQRWILSSNSGQINSAVGWMFTDISADPNWYGVAKFGGQWLYVASSDCILTLTDVDPPRDPRWLGCWDAGPLSKGDPSAFNDRYGFDPLAYIKTFVGGKSYTGSADGWVIPVDGKGKVFGVVQIANKWQIVVSNDCPYDCLNAEFYDSKVFLNRFGFDPLLNLP